MRFKLRNSKISVQTLLSFLLCPVSFPIHYGIYIAIMRMCSNMHYYVTHKQSNYKLWDSDIAFESHSGIFMVFLNYFW
jgi:hypothetical protein